MIREEDWLAQAKKLPIGRTRRIQHGREKRPSMVVGNDSGHWWCYCQSCKEGGKIMKEHVRVTGVPAPKESDSLVLPHDMVHIMQAEPAVRDGVLGFIAHKNMDALYMPPIWYSPMRKRLLLQTEHGWLGRDTTERSPQKWLTFDPATKHLGTARPGMKQIAVVVEDPFSFYKVRWALQDRPEVTVFSSLGTAVKDALAMVLLGYHDVWFMYDGDAAGRRGAIVESARFRAFGGVSEMRLAPPGMDPKDMTIDQIREHLK